MDKVNFYVTGAYKQKIYFPNGNVCCRWCRYCRYKNTQKERRTICTKTYESITNIDTIGQDCPLEFTGEIIEKKEPS